MVSTPGRLPYTRTGRCEPAAEWIGPNPIADTRTEPDLPDEFTGAEGEGKPDTRYPAPDTLVIQKPLDLHRWCLLERFGLQNHRGQATSLTNL